MTRHIGVFIRSEEAGFSKKPARTKIPTGLSSAFRHRDYPGRMTLPESLGKKTMR
ncbi:hypothetical protein BN1184_AH_00490 [Pantoea ananatis]|nr:hypothetical protein V462_20100 [Pantoea ananatis 15320]CRH36401.1 hypothetical protein BN1184_AH_00490 [Pantoea ananatis]